MSRTSLYSFVYNVDKGQEKTYIKIPLNIPDDVERIDITYDYLGANKNPDPIGDKNVMDIAILDPEGNDIGATGSSYKSISFGETYSSPGFKMLKLTKGTWYILLGAYMVKGNGATVTYDITYHFKEYKWLKGDTHIHTVNSDGKYDYMQIASLAKKKKLDFIIITDHNNTMKGYAPNVDGLTIIDGLEFTNYNGHFNFWGVAKPYSGTYAVNTFEDFLKLSNEGGEKGAIRTINHPESPCPWLWGYDFDYEGIEVWNGPFIKDNLKSIELWDGLLKKGRKIFAVGGSDFHKFDFTFAVPRVSVYSKSSSKADILDGLRNGRIVIQYSKKSPMLYLKCKDAVCGDTVKLEPGLEAVIECKVKKGQELVVITNKGIIHNEKITKSREYRLQIPIKEKGYIRAELRAKPNLLHKLIDKLVYKFTRPGVKVKSSYFVTSMTNPIYFD